MIIEKLRKIWDSSKEYIVAEINQSNGWNNEIINFLVQSVLNEGKLAEITCKQKLNAYLKWQQKYEECQDGNNQNKCAMIQQVIFTTLINKSIQMSWVLHKTWEGTVSSKRNQSNESKEMKSRKEFYSV